jgi:hypothetical protein
MVKGMDNLLPNLHLVWEGRNARSDIDDTPAKARDETRAMKINE